MVTKTTVTLYLCYVMASDVWGCWRTFYVLACFFVVFSLTTDTEEEIDDGTMVFSVLSEIILWIIKFTNNWVKLIFRLMTHQTCCATLLRSATMPNAAATKRTTNMASSDTDDDVLISATLLVGAIANVRKRKRPELVKEVSGHVSGSNSVWDEVLAYHTLLQSLATNCATKIWIGTCSISLQLVAETPYADWSVRVYVWLFTSASVYAGPITIRTAAGGQIASVVCVVCKKLKVKTIK